MANNRCTLLLLLAVATALACTENTSPTTGQADVTLSVSGLDIDPNGFDVVVDGNSATTIAGSGSVTVDLLIGQHTVTLGGLAANCTLQLPVADRITVSQGETVRVDFAVICTALTGVVKINAATTGLDFDPDGYQISVGSSAVQVTANGSAWIANVAGGTYSLSVGGLAPNCVAAGSNPTDVSVSVGGVVRDTALVNLSVSCTATTGVLKVTTVTTGPDPDPDGYTARIDGGVANVLATNGVGPITGVPGGAHSVQLAGMADNCSVTGSNPANFSMAVGGAVRDTARVTFNVTCAKIPRTGADLVVTTTGTNPDDQYHVVIYGSCYYYCNPVWVESVPANGTVSLDLPVDDYTYSVSDVATNCSGPGSGAFTVTRQHVTTVAMAFTCLPSGTVDVSVQATGADIQGTYAVYVDRGNPASVAAGGHVPLEVVTGTHSIWLPNIEANCSVAAPNPVSVTVTANATVNVSFAVTCVAKATLRVTATTIGANAPANFLVGVDPDYYYGYQITAPIPSNGTVSIKLQAGSHVVTLDDVPTNCSVTSANNVTVNLSNGSTTDLAFTVSCR
jgi:hypothetical protein